MHASCRSIVAQPAASPTSAPAYCVDNLCCRFLLKVVLPLAGKPTSVTKRVLALSLGWGIRDVQGMRMSAASMLMDRIRV